MFSPRNFQSILDEYLSTIRSTSSPLSLDPNPSSPLYTLARANSAVIQNLELRLASLITSYSPITASGSDLDSLTSYLVTRTPPSYSEGVVTILPTSKSILVPQGTVLTDTNSGSQFYTLSAVSTSTNPEQNTLVNVASFVPGSSYNLTAGTPLFNSELISAEPTIRFFVGKASSKTSFSEGFFGGSDEESDFSLRARYFYYLYSNNHPYSISTLKSVLQAYTGVTRSYVKTRIPGIVEVWVNFLNSYSSIEVDSLTSYLEPYIPAGIIVSVNNATVKSVSISIKVTPYSSDYNISSLNSQISEVLYSSVNSLDINQPLPLSLIKFSVLPLVQDCTVLEPSSDVTADINEIIVLSSINVSYPS